ncbi:MAG: restriction endonuclease subunit S [Muribaculaceae bacterium]|nr:restriction endonuclease subunit S [Muribaculaceae bacterium]
MTTQNNIPAGYKDSAVGIIPQEWEVMQIRDLGRVITGNTPPTADSSNYGNEYMFVSPADLLDDQKYILRTEKMLSAKGYTQARKIPQGSVLYTCIGSTIGKIGIASDELASNQQINAVICNDCGEFLYYALLHRTNRIKLLAGEQAVPIINKSDFEKIKLPVPPMVEQKKIAEILGVWDEAIEKQSRLVERLELRKRGLMQRLLTGRTRLPGFTTPWQKVKLGEICKERNETKCEHLPLLSITAERGVILQSESDKKDTSNEDKSKYKRICPNDIGYNTMRMWQGRSALSAMEGIVSPAYTIVTPKAEVDPLFISELIKQPRVVYDFWTHSQGLVGDTLNCKFHDFSQVKVAIPSLPEQKAIAEVLTAADNEIATHRKRLDALRLQKRGHMQQLLTGKTRVKI